MLSGRLMIWLLTDRDFLLVCMRVFSNVQFGSIYFVLKGGFDDLIEETILFLNSCHFVEETHFFGSYYSVILTGIMRLRLFNWGLGVFWVEFGAEITCPHALNWFNFINVWNQFKLRCDQIRYNIAFTGELLEKFLVHFKHSLHDPLFKSFLFVQLTLFNRFLQLDLCLLD